MLDSLQFTSKPLLPMATWHKAHSTKKPVTTMLTYPWKCTVLHCNHLGNTWKPLVLMTRHFDYRLSASEGDNQSVRSSAPVVSRCFPSAYNVKLYISRGRLAWWLLAFLHSDKAWCKRSPIASLDLQHVVHCKAFLCQTQTQQNGSTNSRWGWANRPKRFYTAYVKPTAAHGDLM